MKIDKTALFAPTDKIVEKTISINAPASKVWDALTNPEMIRQWLADNEITVASDWEVGSAMIYSGKWHGMKFEDKGVIQRIEPEKVLEYRYWSKISKLPFAPENCIVICFTLNGSEDHTILDLTITNLRNATTYSHNNYYWGITLGIIKNLVEKNV